MKNKAMTYVLGFAVVAVWGLIIYRILQATGGDDTPSFQNATVVKKEAFNDYAIPKDTTHLLLNYRDPFSEKKIDTMVIPARKTMDHLKNNFAPAKPVKPAINWNFIRYTGFINNPGSKKFLAMISINGREVMMAEGETVDQVKLIKNSRDSVKIMYQGATKFITMNKGQ